MDRKKLLRAVSKRLGTRSLVWAGIRGDDVEPITDLPNLTASYSIIGAYLRRTSVESLAYEDLTGARVDLELWDIDDHLDADATATFRRALLHSLAQPSALLTYRPSRFLSAIGFARRDRCLNIGLFGSHQAAFEHKPWVESAVAELGLPHIPWTYVADEEQLRTRDLLEVGPLVLRRSRTSGGEGFVRVDDPSQLVDQWPRAEESFVSVAPFIEGATPVNVGAVVWNDGVTIHYPSVQLIGIASCVTRPFGYCGNDFGLMREFDPVLVDQIEHAVQEIGKWLHGYGYRGTFGVDFLIDQGVVLFTEVNPRFQGSTHASARLSIEADESCLFLEHIAAMLGLPAPTARPLREQVQEVAPLAHLVVHWTGEDSAHLDPNSLIHAALRQADECRVDVLTRGDLVTERGGVVGRLTVRGQLTTDGFALVPSWAAVVDDWRAQVHLDGPPDRPIKKARTDHVSVQH